MTQFKSAKARFVKGITLSNHEHILRWLAGQQYASLEDHAYRAECVLNVQEKPQQKDTKSGKQSKYRNDCRNIKAH